jgi:hypothetical protein
MTLGQNDFVQCCCSDIKILYGHMNFIVLTSSGSLVTIGPCSYYLARRETTFDSMLYPILLLSWLSARFPLPESWLYGSQEIHRTQ